MTAVQVGGMTPMGSVRVKLMTNTTSLPDVTVGTGEPASSRILLTLFAVGVLGLLALFSNVFGWDNIPLLGELVPLIGNLGGSGIWYYLIGLLIGIGAIVASLLAEVIVD
jgi:hypothetical protein